MKSLLSGFSKPQGALRLKSKLAVRCLLVVLTGAYTPAAVPATIKFLGGSSSSAYAINATGQAVGKDNAATAPNYPHAFLYSGGKATDLGALPGQPFSEATGINDSGQIVGTSFVPGTVNQSAFLYSEGKMIDIGTFSGSTAPTPRTSAMGQCEWPDRGNFIRMERC